MATTGHVPLNINGDSQDNRSLVTKKKILLVSPDSGTVSTERLYLAPPLGVMRLAGYLNAKGHEANYYDPNLYTCSGQGPSLAGVLEEKEWDIIGFSVLDETLIQDIQNMYDARRLQPKALIIAGGIEAQFNYQTLLDKTPCRIVILGEGEVPLRMLADGEPVGNIPGIVVKNLAEPMQAELFNEATQLIPWETINYEAYWGVYKDLYGDRFTEEIANQTNTVRIFSRNRCPIGCKYCSSTFQLTLASGGKVPVISTTEGSLIEVIERIVASHPEVRLIYLTDDDFVINKPSVIEFCKKVIERDFGDLNFMCFARITDLTEEVIQWMSKANFRTLNIGVESFSQKVLDEVGKRCDVDRIPGTLELLKRYGIRPYCNIILSTPQSTLEDVETSLDGIMGYITDDFYQASIHPAIHPLKGTEFAERYWDYKSHVIQIPGTDHYIRRDDFIQPEDPLMREFQTRFVEGVDAAVEQFVREQDVRHAHAASLALMQCRYAKKLISEIREEAKEGKLGQNTVTTPGAGRTYTNQRTWKDRLSLPGSSDEDLIVEMFRDARA
ncbi:B12-binding domain-containing radical SAM protein [Dehalococcoidia bacterium]|nr:B12-binding domain-containing radical SAM protein [Dehalococcoidia bacterium]